MLILWRFRDKETPICERGVKFLRYASYVNYWTMRPLGRGSAEERNDQDLLLEHVWGSEYLGESHMLQVNINRLRRKIEADPTHPLYLLTKVGIGYLLAAHPEVHTAK